MLFSRFKLSYSVFCISLLSGCIEVDNDSESTESANPSVSETQSAVTITSGKGMLASALGGVCLDSGGGTLGVRPYTRTCNSSFGAVFWQLQNGLLRASTGGCLDAGGGPPPAMPYLAACNNTNQNHLWDWTADGMLKSNIGNLCLDVGGGGINANPYLRTCDAGNANLRWSFTPTGRWVNDSFWGETVFCTEPTAYNVLECNTGAACLVGAYCLHRKSRPSTGSCSSYGTPYRRYQCQ
jgi:Ricin-type beta-trefoil lectin domain